MNWFECKASYEKIGENGIPTKKTEAYMIDALSFTEAEARITKELLPFVSIGEFNITDIKRVKIVEIFTSDEDKDDRYYKAKVFFISIDEKTALEKKTAQLMMIQSSSLEEAVVRLKKEMDKTLATYEIASITDTNILDIFPFEAVTK